MEHQRNHANHQRDPRAEEHAAQDIASLAVGAGRVGGAGCQEIGPAKVAAQGVMRRQQWREQRGENRNADEQQAESQLPRPLTIDE